MASYVVDPRVTSIPTTWWDSDGVTISKRGEHAAQRWIEEFARLRADVLRVEGKIRAQSPEIIRRAEVAVAYDGLTSLWTADKPSARRRMRRSAVENIGTGPRHLGDPYGDQCKQGLRETKALRLLVRNLEQIVDGLASQELQREVQPSTCRVGECERDARKAGFCGACYEAWDRWRQSHDSSCDPGGDKQRFIRYRNDWFRRQRDEAKAA